MNYAHIIGNNIMSIHISVKLGLPWHVWVFIHLIFSLRIRIEVAANKLIDMRFLLCNS